VEEVIAALQYAKPGSHLVYDKDSQELLAFLVETYTVPPPLPPQDAPSE
jgi:hypothetical protein